MKVLGLWNLTQQLCNELIKNFVGLLKIKEQSNLFESTSRTGGLPEEII